MDGMDSMDRLEQEAYRRMIGRVITSDPIDRKLAVYALRASDNAPEVISLVLQARKAHQTWVTRTQREWQGKTKNGNKARHHDSVAIREYYVTCGAKTHGWNTTVANP